MSSIRKFVPMMVFLSLMTPALAQQDPHHPTGTDADASAQTTPQPAPDLPPQAGSMPMMGPCMEMMRGMMGQGVTPMDTMGMAAMGMIDHIEGRIAFVRAELAITDVQAPDWNAFADALRDNAKRINELRPMAMSQPGVAMTIASRLEHQETLLSSRLEGVRGLKSAFTSLVAVLDEAQRKTLDNVLPIQFGPHML